MRAAILVALAFVGGIVLSVLALSPPEVAIAAESVGSPPVGPVTDRQARSGVEAPTWHRGDAWQVRFGGSDGVTCWLVVAGDEARYQQGVECGDSTENVATSIAAFSEGWIGSFSHDLEGRFHDEDVRFFDWPLTDGKTWNTTWFQTRMAVKASYAVLDGPSGKEPGYKLKMEVAGSRAGIVEYDYLPSLAWWSKLYFPQSDYTVRVLGRQTGWDAPVLVGSSEIRLEDTFTGVGLQPPTTPRPFTMEESDTKLVLFLQRDRAAAGRLSIKDPTGAEAVGHVGLAGVGAVNGLGYPGQQIRFIDSSPGVWTLEREAVAANEIVRIQGVHLERVVP